MVCELNIQDDLLAEIFLYNPTEIPRPMNFFSWRKNSTCQGDIQNSKIYKSLISSTADKGFKQRFYQLTEKGICTGFSTLYKLFTVIY